MNKLYQKVYKTFGIKGKWSWAWASLAGDEPTPPRGWRRGLTRDAAPVRGA